MYQRLQAPLITVILPVYDGGATLESALRSILGQTFQDYEILLLNDGSRDESLKVATKFSDSRLHIINDRVNRGLAWRLNQGIDLARGRYIARMDQDDMSFPTRLSQQFEYLEAHREIDLLGCRAVMFRNDREILGLIPYRGTHEEICAHPSRGFYLAHPTWMGRTEWFRRYYYHLPEPIRAEDQELLLRAYQESRFACLDTVLHAYHQGRFNLHKTLIGRRSLLISQLYHFRRRRQFGNMVFALVLTTMKALIDCVTALPGCERIFSFRMAERVPLSVSEKMQSLLLNS